MTDVLCPLCAVVLTTIDEATETCLVLDIDEDGRLGVDYEPRITDSGKPLPGDRHYCELP